VLALRPRLRSLQSVRALSFPGVRAGVKTGLAYLVCPDLHGSALIFTLMALGSVVSYFTHSKRRGHVWTASALQGKN